VPRLGGGEACTGFGKNGEVNPSYTQYSVQLVLSRGRNPHYSDSRVVAQLSRFTRIVATSKTLPITGCGVIAGTG
jgi:hypothetical protein